MLNKSVSPLNPPIRMDLTQTWLRQQPSLPDDGRKQASRQPSQMRAQEGPRRSQEDHMGDQVAKWDHEIARGGLPLASLALPEAILSPIWQACLEAWRKC